MQIALEHNSLDLRQRVSTWLQVASKRLVHFVSEWLGLIGLVCLSPIVVPFALIAFLSSRTLFKTLIKKIGLINHEISISEVDISSGSLGDVRILMDHQLTLSRILRNYEEARDILEGAPRLVRWALKYEEDFFEEMKAFNSNLVKMLYPNLSKEYTQEELVKLSNEQVTPDDLDDEEVDKLMELYS